MPYESNVEHNPVEVSQREYLLDKVIEHNEYL